MSVFRNFRNFSRPIGLTLPTPLRVAGRFPLTLGKGGSAEGADG